MDERAIVIVDVAGSTPLYEAEGDQAAMQMVTDVLDRISGILSTFDGEFVVSRGDDVHFLFEKATAAFAAAEVVLADPRCRRMPLHYAMHWGESLPGAHQNIYGDAVNLTARLAAISNPGEALLSRDFHDKLPVAERAKLRPLQRLAIKGRSEPVEVFALFAKSVDTASRTILPSALAAANAGAATALVVAGDQRIEVQDGEAITMGRADGCTLVLDAAWVSRLHATLRVRGALVELTDKSANGTYLSMGDGAELLIRREAVVLAGEGVISPGVTASDPSAKPIRYKVGSAADWPLMAGTL